MPTRRVNRLLVRSAVAAAALMAVVAPATASAASSCNIPSTTQVFSRWGDLNYYYLVPGGDFEKFSWNASGGADLLSVNDPFNLRPGTTSIGLQSGQSVTSVRFCIAKDLPHLRLMARAYGDADLRARVEIAADTGTTPVWAETMLPAAEHRAWAPSRFISLNTAGMADGETAWVTLRLSSTAGSEWRIDNVFIDPYRR